MTCTKLTRVQGRHSFLVEYSGEGSAHTSSDSCSGKLHNDMDNLSQCRSGRGYCSQMVDIVLVTNKSTSLHK